MAARAYWKGQIRIALVSIPVEIYPATQSGAQISFRQIHEPSGKRIKYEKVVPGVGPVDHDEIIKGFEYEKDSYVLLDQDEIDAVKLESKKTLMLTRFVDAHEIDVLYYEKPYYVVPADDLAEEAYVVLREALRKTKKVGVGQLAVRGSEHLISLKPCGNGLVLETLRYADEVKKAQSYFEDIDDIKPDKELLNLAEKLIEEKSAPFDPEEYQDRYVDALQKLIAKKRKAGGKKVLEDVEDSTDESGNVIDLMAALKKSVAEKDGGKKPSAKKSRSRKAS
ncbi:Ku protein [Parasphingorhabdus sp.]|uniref:non-homologous end joining protein Ku n=1 Tax=Parasphingorhabdus sp. TaxID=2709688 RepID=UPI002F91EF50